MSRVIGGRNGGLKIRFRYVQCNLELKMNAVQPATAFDDYPTWSEGREGASFLF